MTLDIQNIRRLLACDNEFLCQIFCNYIDETREIICEIEFAFDKYDYSTIARKAHKMLSSTRVLDLDDLSETLKKLELSSGSQLNEDEIPLLLTKIKSMNKIIIDKMKQFVSGTTKIKKPF